MSDREPSFAMWVAIHVDRIPKLLWLSVCVLVFVGIVLQSH